MIKKIQASIVILTKNEERHVERAVDSCADFNEVIVVDSSSTDKTVELAKNSGAIVLQFDWNNRYPKKKEWALKHCTHDWVIYLDADEYFTPELVKEIRLAVNDQSLAAFAVPLKYFWMGKELRYGHRVSKRIGMRQSRCSWPRPNDLHVKNMWEVEGHYQPQLQSGVVQDLRQSLGHNDEDGLYDYFARHNRYSDWEAQMLFDQDVPSLESRSRLGRLAAKVPLRGPTFFVYSYFMRLGFLDGRPGFHYALALSFYYWQIGLKKFELRRIEESGA